MFTKEIKVDGNFVKGKIIGGVLHTSQLVSQSGKLVTIEEIENVIVELQLVKKELEENQ